MASNPIHPLISGYVAARILDGIQTSIPTLETPEVNAYDVAEARDIWSRLNVEHQSALFLYLGGRQPLDPGRDNEMMGVLSGLKRYSLPLSIDPGRVVEHQIRTVLPSFDSQIRELLAKSPFTPFGEEDALAMAMARWFKRDYMRWVDPVKCPMCGGSTTSTGSAEPNSQERMDGGGRVEIHQCEDEGCRAGRRFARYGSVKTLLRTREGRCGEWAHLFYIFLRVAGLEARYIWNSEDHVWTEYWSPSLQHWVHVDSCEAAVNKSLLYALGWGKKQAFCLAVGPYGAEDVTRAYIDDWDGACRSRRVARGWREKALKRALLEQTVSLRLALRPDERARLEAMDTMQALWQADERGRLAEAEREELGGRTSGPVDWRATRDELGLQEAKKPPTSFLRQIHAGHDTLETFGDARLTDGLILLTLGSSQSAAVFSPSPLRQAQSFRCQMDFRLTAPPGSGEADGIAMVFCPEKKLGVGGYGLGYSGLGGQGDFAVEVDTYRTQDHAEDPPTPHVSVHSPPHAHHRHSIACTPPHSLPYLSDGKVYTLELLYKGSTRRLRGFLTGAGEGGRKDSEMSLFDVVIPVGGGGDWYVGVTGSCGGLWQRQEILKLSLDEIEFPSEAPAQSVEGENAMADTRACDRNQ